jgi:hypothetical protein
MTFFSMLLNAVVICGVVVMTVVTAMILWPLYQSLAVFSVISAIFLLHSIYGSYLDEAD